MLAGGHGGSQDCSSPMVESSILTREERMSSSDSYMVTKLQLKRMVERLGLGCWPRHRRGRCWVTDRQEHAAGDLSGEKGLWLPSPSHEGGGGGRWLVLRLPLLAAIAAVVLPAPSLQPRGWSRTTVKVGLS